MPLQRIAIYVTHRTSRHIVWDFVRFSKNFNEVVTVSML